MLHSPLEAPSSHLRERCLSFLALGGNGVESGDELDVAELYHFYLFIFNFSFGDERTIKKCSADFFNSTVVVDPRISNPVKQYFYKIMLQTLNPIKASMLLGDSADERNLPALAEILRYLKEEMPIPKGIGIESYIRAIAENEFPGEFPYDSVEQEKFHFLRYALQKNYYFFEYIFTETDGPTTREVSPIFKIQCWLYYELTFQFILNRKEGIIERIRSELPSDDEDEDEERTQEPSKLKIAHQDLLQALYQHLKTLLKRHTHLSVPATRTAFFLVYQLSFELIQKGATKELNALLDILLQPPTGIRFLCMAQDGWEERPVEKWLDLLGDKRSLLLFSKILSILPRLKIKQMLALLNSTLMDILKDRLSRKHKLRLLLKLLDLDFPAVDMCICENNWLIHIAKKNNWIEMLRERIWRSFSLESITKEEEIQRNFFSDRNLINGSKKALAQLLDLPVLNNFLLEKFHNIESGIKKSSIRIVWIDALKAIWNLVLHYWRPSDKDLGEISHIKEQWVNTMMKTLSGDNSIYDPQYYTVDKLPRTMRATLEGNIEVMVLYQEQLDIMADSYRRFLDLVAVLDNKANTPSSAVENRISFIELIRAFAAQKGIDTTEEQIQACAKNLSLCFKEVIATGEVYSLEPMFFGLTQNNSGAADVQYLSTQYTQLFLELLENAMLKKSSVSLFSSTGLVLRKKETKGAIDEFLRALSEQKQVRYRSSSASSGSIVRGASTTPSLESAADTTPYLISPFPSPSGKL